MKIPAAQIWHSSPSHAAYLLKIHLHSSVQITLFEVTV